MIPELDDDRYHDLVPIGSGGFGTVYAAADAQELRTVAIKVLAIGDAPAVDLARFERERMAMQSLSKHPAIVTLLGAGTTTDGRHYLVMELLGGGTLAERLADGPMHWDEATHIAIELADALAAAHRAGVLHRDVKPENVLAGDDGRWRLIDFGVALVFGAHRTATGELVASLAHAAPETFGGGHDRASRDVWGLASTLFTMLTATEPFAPRPGEPPLATMQRIATEPLPDLRRHGVPGRLASVLEVAMSKDPEDRHGGAADFAAALQSARRSLGAAPIVREAPTPNAATGTAPRGLPTTIMPSAPPAGMDREPSDASGRRRLGVVTAAAAVCGALGLGFFVEGEDAVPTAAVLDTVPEATIMTEADTNQPAATGPVITPATLLLAEPDPIGAPDAADEADAVTADRAAGDAAPATEPAAETPATTDAPPATPPAPPAAVEDGGDGNGGDGNGGDGDGRRGQGRGGDGRGDGGGRGDGPDGGGQGGGGGLDQA